MHMKFLNILGTLGTINFVTTEPHVELLFGTEDHENLLMMEFIKIIFLLYLGNQQEMYEMCSP